jgi:hypothetical protein
MLMLQCYIASMTSIGPKSFSVYFLQDKDSLIYNHSTTIKLTFTYYYQRIHTLHSNFANGLIMSTFKASSMTYLLTTPETVFPTWIILGA